MQKICFLSMDDLGDYVTDDHLTIEPLKQLGWDVETVSWRSETVDWSEFKAVIIRSPWDYHKDPDAFLRVLRQIEASGARLENPLEIVEWNFSKTYLSKLSERDVRIVPTIWNSRVIGRELVEGWFEFFDADEVVIKPTISATAKDTYRLNAYSPELKAVFSNRDYMIQPLMKTIISEGEYSLFYFGGEFSHAILKTPKTNDFRVQEDFGGVNRSIEASDKLLTAAEAALEAIGTNLLYARVDLVRDDADEFALMELELIEPALYFRMDAKSPERFANALNRWMNEL
ncbi:MAG: hypothetical protein HKN25_08085 [Pyrinomonadaceae bacterium]|nr:hypothetical protein [Pyrinomonadaceae bacterium]